MPPVDALGAWLRANEDRHEHPSYRQRIHRQHPEGRRYSRRTSRLPADTVREKLLGHSHIQ